MKKKGKMIINVYGDYSSFYNNHASNDFFLVFWNKYLFIKEVVVEFLDYNYILLSKNLPFAFMQYSLYFVFFLDTQHCNKLLLQLLPFN